MSVPDRLAEWIGALLIAMFGGLSVLLRRWISMLHKHENEIALLKAEQAHNKQTSSEILDSVNKLGDELRRNREIAAETLQAVREEVRDDIRQFISLLQKRD